MDIKEYQLQQGTGHSRHFWELAKTRFLLKLTGKYLKNVNTVTDIGCGDGYVISRIAEKYRNIRFYGVDSALTDDMIQSFEADFKTRELQIKLSRELPGDQSDAVFMFDVLEHIEHDQEYLEKLQILHSAGLLVLTVPAFQSLFSEHDSFLGHYRRYNRKQLISAAESAGFISLESGYFFTILLLPRFLQKLFCRKFSGLTGSSGAGKLNFLFAAILYIDAVTGYFLKHLKIQLPGLSCYLICRKR